TRGGSADVNLSWNVENVPDDQRHTLTLKIGNATPISVINQNSYTTSISDTTTFILNAQGEPVANSMSSEKDVTVTYLPIIA
ncbi:hypothetical protein ABTL59_19760, partial [Acinetobacter baumannii]